MAVFACGPPSLLADEAIGRRERTGRLHDPALHDRIPGVDRFVRPDDAGETVRWRPDLFDDVTEHIAHVRYLLARLELVSDVDGQSQQPAAPVPQRFVGSNSSPDWSPDGNYLAYASRRGIVRYDPASSVLVIRALVSGKERELTPRLNHFSRPRWSPDGRHVLVQGNDRRNRQGLYKINVQTGEVAPVVQVQPGVYALEASWSPDGKEIFYRRQDSGGKIARFFVREVESGREKGLIHSAEGSFFLSPALSPDGRQLAFVLRDEKTGSTALRIMPSHGGEPRELLRVGEPEFIQYGSVEWTTDGRKILFARGRFTPQEPRGSLWQVSSRGGEPERVDLTADGMRDVRLHPDGRRVAFTAGFNRAEIWVMENFLPVREAAP